MKLKKLAELCRLTVAGSGNQEVYAITYADEALENDIAVAFSIRELKNTQAKVVLTEPVICDTDKTLVYCNYGSIFAAVAKVVQIFTQLGYYKEYQHIGLYSYICRHEEYRNTSCGLVHLTSTPLRRRGHPCWISKSCTGLHGAGHRLEQGTDKASIQHVLWSCGW